MDARLAEALRLAGAGDFDQARRSAADVGDDAGVVLVRARIELAAGNVAGADVLLSEALGSAASGKAQDLASDLIERSADPNEMLTRTLRAMVEASGAEHGFLVYEDARGALRVHATHRLRDEEVNLSAPGLSLAAVQEALDRDDVVMTSDAVAEAWAQRTGSIPRLGIQSILCVPVARRPVRCVVYLDRRQSRDPFTAADLDLVRALGRRIAPVVAQAIELNRSRTEVRVLKEVIARGLSEMGRRYRFGEIVGRSPAMLEVYRMIEAVSPVPYSVLIEGETGTGKELVAKAVHFGSPRKDRPVTSISCGALSDTLLDSELFGHVRGAFTGADADRPGLFELSDGGTLFLDEVEAMSPAMQKKLLRVLELGRVRPVGGRTDMEVDVRVIAASNRRLDELVREGSFREDLFYRLNHLTLRLPPLRERPEDIPLLAEYFLDAFAAETATPRKQLAPSALDRLGAYGWPGNVRQLRNEMRRLTVLAPARIEAEHLSEAVRGVEGTAPAGGAHRERMDAFERSLLVEALERNGWNVRSTARAIQMNRNTLMKRIDDLGIDVSSRPTS